MSVIASGMPRVQYGAARNHFERLLEVDVCLVVVFDGWQEGSQDVKFVPGGVVCFRNRKS